MRNREHQPAADPTYQPLAKLVARDFWFSFRFSQGVADDQHNLFGLLAIQYARTLSPIELGQLPAALRSIRKDRLPLPASHAKRPGWLVEAAKRNQLRKFGATIGKALTGTMTEADYAVGLQKFTIDLLKVDATYQRDKQRFSASDPHSSLFRQYVVLGNEPGTPTFQAIFDDARQSFDQSHDPELRRSYVALSRGWSNRHPGESFIPADVPTAFQPSAAISTFS